MPAIRAICFDLDDTLWPMIPVIKAAEQAAYDWLNTHYPRITAQFSVDQLRELRDQLLQQRPELFNDVTLLRILSLEQAAQYAHYENPQEIARDAFDVFICARHDVEVFADVTPVLQRLKQRYLLCSLTNGNADVNLVEIGRFFDLSLMARDVGAAKPHPALFIAACEFARAAPEEIVHVGDDALCDIEGAVNAGLKAVWINRYQREWSGAVTPHAIISSLEELETLLAAWEAE
jgi:putative hydrolase of the HAD superfamily